MLTAVRLIIVEASPNLVFIFYFAQFNYSFNTGATSYIYFISNADNKRRNIELSPLHQVCYIVRYFSNRDR